MLERDLQDHLFQHPDLLFPGRTVLKRHREVSINGRRIDLLFEVDGVNYIVELKRDTISRQDVGQIFEYYGLMRCAKPTQSFRMILAAPSIPEYRRIPLEEMGIRCVEVALPARDVGACQDVSRAIASQRQRRPDLPEVGTLGRSLTFQDLMPPVNPEAMQLSQQLLRASLPAVQRTFSSYEILPVRMVKPNQPDVLILPKNNRQEGSRAVGAGAWWAYSFGHSDEMPKNDLPNISVNALPWGLDFAINAELRTSQLVMRKRIGMAREQFNRLIEEQGELRLQTWLKLEFQPRLYFWVLMPEMAERTWKADEVLHLHRETEANYLSKRSARIEEIQRIRPDLTPAQRLHLQSRSRNLNLAIRFVYTFRENHPIWKMNLDEQIGQFDSLYARLKPLIDFFQ